MLKINKLSDASVRSKKKRGLYGDGAGLFLQVGVNGAKSWIFRYTRNGRMRSLGLGAVHTVTLSAARVKAKELRNALLDGDDVAALRQQQKAAPVSVVMTFGLCAAKFIESREGEWSNDRHAGQWTTTLATHAATLTHMPVSAIDTAHVMRVLEPLWGNRTITATRVRQRIERILDWATVHGYRTGANPARWRGHLEHALAKPARVANRQRHPSLPWQRVPGFLADLRACGGVAAMALEFTIQTAARSNEVRGARWSEFDIAGKTWTIPAARMKARVEHTVPLSGAALSLLERLPRMHSDSDLVFPSPVAGRVLADLKVSVVARRMESEWLDDNGERITTHGFRSSFRVWAAECTSFPREVAEHALAHRLPDAVEAAYQRSTLLVKRALLMQSWGKYCESAPAAGKVIRLKVRN